MKKKEFSEQDIRTKYITPAILNAGWDRDRQLREEYSFTAGKIKVHGKVVSRGKAKKADYILLHSEGNIPLAIVEAKSNDKPLGAGLPQALDYANILDVPFAFSSNGDGFILYDRTKAGQSEDNIEQEIRLDDFPSPHELWARYKVWKGIEDEEQEELITQPYHYEIDSLSPRYYQRIAINRTVEAIAKGQKRIMLVMATGTGKTFTAFQIIWRIWKSGGNKRILYLADRNILVDDPKRKYFGPFGDKVTKLSRKNVSKAHQIYFALYQAVTGNKDYRDIFTQYSSDFFDIIIVDECHRGSAAADSQWREVLEYFEPATQIGMTATPKETDDVSNIDYFGNPLYTYSLRQGIEDGFLAPYKVIRYTLDRDAEGWRPEMGKKDIYGNEIPDRIYNKKDFDRKLVLGTRTGLVARKVTKYLQDNDSYAKTIIFCQDIEHADRMRRAMVNLNPKLVSKNERYAARLTGDVPNVNMNLDDFMNPEETYPVVATTSKLLTTGVDIPTCKLIVLDREINSPTEFKQIIGRGTRINIEHDKHYFTIIDFRDVTRHFADPDFDGQPVQNADFTPDQPPILPDVEPDIDAEGDDLVTVDGEAIIGGPMEPGNIEGIPKKFYVDDVEVSILNKRVQYYNNDGKMVTDSVKDFSRKNILSEYETLDNFLKHWKESGRKQAIIDELRDKGVFFDELKKETGKDLDSFDLICHVAYDQPPLTRQERAKQVQKQDYFGKYSETARKVLEGLLEKYADEGLENLENANVLKLNPFNQMGSPIELIEAFGGHDAYLQAIQRLEEGLYSNVS
jgi:type I restriction enzyme R subunit